MCRERLQAITDFDPDPAFLDRRQYQDTVVFTPLPDAPAFEKTVGEVRNLPALERRQRDDGHLRTGLLLELRQKRFHLTPLGTHHIREVIDVSAGLQLIVERIARLGPRAGSGRRRRSVTGAGAGTALSSGEASLFLLYATGEDVVISG